MSPTDTTNQPRAWPVVTTFVFDRVRLPHGMLVMPTEPVKLYLTLFEFALLLGGLGYLIGFCAKDRRERWLGLNRLPTWPITAQEFAIFVFLIFATGFVLQLSLQLALGPYLADLPDRRGLEVFIYGAGFSGGSILGWWIFKVMRKGWYADYGAEIPSATRVAPKLSSLTCALYGAATLLLAMPLVTLTSVGWAAMLKKLGLPEEPQPLIGIFAETQSIAVIIGMLFVACVLAPVSEEILFRSGIYRFLRQKSGRGFALVASGVLFGALHGNWAGLLPLSVLGAVLALAYEATGDIRVPIVAHALFNLNTVVVVLSGISEMTQ